MSEIKIGTCGYGYYQPEDGWKDKYESKLQAYPYDFETVEINKTFYKLPMVKTAEKWRNNARDDFIFNFKAWQALTHTSSSPTWRGYKGGLSDPQLDKFGYLRPNEEVFEAWEETKKIGEALDAEVCLIQTSASFDCTEDHEENMREFFDKIDRDGPNIAWEPRGDWKDNKEKVRELCDELDLIHVVDLLREELLSDHRIVYTRLHGLNEKRYDYDYDYSDEELKTLADKLRELSEKHEKVYCMFNNYEMFDNAKKLKEIL